MEPAGADLRYPSRDELQLAEVLQALAYPVRLEMLRVLEDARSEVPSGKIPPRGKSTSSARGPVFSTLLTPG